jgi:hypothetical protein
LACRLTTSCPEPGLRLALERKRAGPKPRDLAARKFASLDHAQLVATEAVIDRVKDASHVLIGRYGKVLELWNTRAREFAGGALVSCASKPGA